MSNNRKVSSLVSRIFFVIAFTLFMLAIWEKFFNLLGSSFITSSKPITLMIAAGVVLLFVISLQLYELKEMYNWRDGSSD